MTELQNQDWTAACEQVRQAIYRYCSAIDRGQYHWMEGVFHPGATISVGDYDGDCGQFVRNLEKRHGAVVRASHLIGNILIEPAAGDTIFAESYCLAVEQIASPDGEAQDVDRVVRLRYADTFALREGRWLIDRRLVVVDHAMAAVPSATVAQFRGPQATRDAQDPALKMRMALCASR